MKLRHRSSGKRGSVLVLATTIGVIVGLLGMTMIQLGLHSRLLAIRNVQSIIARCASDAGTVEAVYKMQRKLVTETFWDNSNLPSANDLALSNSPSRYSYGLTGDPTAGFVITSTGVCGLSTKITHSILRIGSYWEGINVKGEVDIRVGTSLGVIGPGSPSDLTIRSNTTATDAMAFKAFVTVPGDIICGPGGNPDLVIDTKETTIVLGQMYAAPEAMVFPDVPAPLPWWWPPGGSIAGNTVMSHPGYYRFDTINLPNNAILRINADVVLYVTGAVILNNSAEIIVDPGGSLELYLGTSLEDKNSTGITNATLNATKMKIYGLPTCTQVDLKAKSDLYAAVYAPSADVVLYNAGDFYGAITGNSFDMRNSGDYYFDTNLSATHVNDPAATFVIYRWWED
jgi:hypothetical protein